MSVGPMSTPESGQLTAMVPQRLALQVSITHGLAGAGQSAGVEQQPATGLALYTHWLATQAEFWHILGEQSPALLQQPACPVET